MGAVVSLKPGVHLFPPEKKVIKADDYLAYANGREIIENAEAQAREIVAEAERVYEREKERGYQDGLLEANLRASEHMIDTVSNTVNYFANVEDQMVQLVLQALRKVVGDMDEAELIRRIVHHALNVVRNQKQVTLRVAPDQVEELRSGINTIIADYPSINFVEVVADGRLRKGGCILESDIGIIDASIEVQLEAFRRSMTRSFQRDA
jgi:type III secretion protein L